MGGAAGEAAREGTQGSSLTMKTATVYGSVTCMASDRCVQLAFPGRQAAVSLAAHAAIRETVYPSERA